MADISPAYRVHGEVESTQQSGNVLILKRTPRKIQIQPQVVHIKRGGHVSWWIWDDVVPDGGTIEIEFDEQGGTKGPFKRRLGDPGNPERGKFRKGKKHALSIVSDDADQGDWTSPPGYWKYTVRVRSMVISPLPRNLPWMTRASHSTRWAGFAPWSEITICPSRALARTRT